MSESPDSPSIAAVPEDAHRRSPAASRRRGGSGDRGGRMVGFTLVLALLAAGLAVAGWFLVNQHRLLTEEQGRLADADRRIVALEERLRMTDQVMSETAGETDEQINFWESEIRKLWTVSNERNKKWIQDNQKLLRSQKATIQTLEATDKSLKSTVARHQNALGRQEEVADQLASIELQLQRVLRGQRDLVDKVNATAQTVSGMDGSIGEHEQAIAAIDSYRRQFNTRLIDIERRLDALQPRPSSL